MSFEFIHTDDYEIIISRDDQKRGNDFHELVIKHFSDKDDLIFCLLEMVTLSDIDAIGETYLYSTCTKKESREILDQYKRIISKVLSKFNIIISEYLDWYTRGSYILVKKNDVEYDLRYQTPNWEQENSTVDNIHDRSKYGNQIEDILDEKELQEYLQYYASLLHEELNFKEYPHYCVIVRPISVAEGKEVIQLGNIYLHFATLHERDVNFYLHLINDFLIVWFKRKGVKIIREIQTIAESRVRIESSKNYLPRFTKLRSSASNRLSRKMDPGNHSLEEYYDELFGNEERKIDFKTKLDLLREHSFPLFFKLKNYLQSPKDRNIPGFSKLSEHLNFSDKLFGIQGQSVLSKKFNLDHFVKTLIRREFFKIGFLIFKIEPHIIRNILMDADDLGYSQSGEANYTYIWTEMFIPWSKIGKKDNLDSKIVECMSEFEKDFFIDCQAHFEKLQKATPDYSLS